MKPHKKALVYLICAAMTLSPAMANAASDNGVVVEETDIVMPESVSLGSDALPAGEYEPDYVINDPVDERFMDLPEADELLEGFIETKIYEETGDESSLQGYDPVIDTEGDVEEQGPAMSFNMLQGAKLSAPEPLTTNRTAVLSPVQRAVYDKVGVISEKIANGTESTAVFRIFLSDLNLPKTSFTAEDLGVSSIGLYDHTCNKCGHVTTTGSDKAPSVCGYDDCDGTKFTTSAPYRNPEAIAAATKLVREQIALCLPATYTNGQKDADYDLYTASERDNLAYEYRDNRMTILYAVLADEPYNMYWYDKTVGWQVNQYWKYSGDTARLNLVSDNPADKYNTDESSYIRIRMPVSADFDDEDDLAAANAATTFTASSGVRNGSLVTCKTSSEEISKVTGIVDTARAIANEADATCVSDYDKLLYFKNIIQNKLAPDYDGEHSDKSYGSPWQLINVFDNDPSTKVVCEGYSKAFKLLCDLSDFSYPDFDCYLISGNLNYSGNGHMWNSVCMDDGQNYLIDITNSKNRMDLFMQGYENYDGTWYTYKKGTGTSKYSYKEMSLFVFSDDELNMSHTAYDSNCRYFRSDFYAYMTKSEYDYTGSPVIPEFRVYNDELGKYLKEGTDYTVSYSNNTKAGRASMTITGKGAYSGSSIPLYYTIKPIDIAGETAYDHLSLKASESAQTPKPHITWGSYSLVAGKDYDMTYLYNVTTGDPSEASAISDSDPVIIDENNPSGLVPGKYIVKSNVTLPGDYLIRVTGRDNFCSETFIRLTVMSEGLSVDKLTVEAIPDQRYQEDSDKKPVKITPYSDIVVRDKSDPNASPEETLRIQYSDDPGNKAHTVYDYKVLGFENNDRVGTAFVIIEGNEAYGYYGTRRIPFKITGTPINKARVSGLSKLTLSESVYTGNAVKLEDMNLLDSKVTVTVNGSQLEQYKSDTKRGDYTVTYVNNINVGTATIIFTGKNGYTGTLKKTFKITSRDIAEKKTNSKIKVELSSTGEPGAKNPVAEYQKTGAKPEVTVTETDDSGRLIRTLRESVDYTLSYANNKKITGDTPAAKVTVKGKGNYKGVLTEFYCVSPCSLENNIQVYAPDIAVAAGKEKANNYKSKVTVTGIDGKTLSSGSDYTIDYYRCKADDYVANKDQYAPLTKVDTVSSGDFVTVVITAKDKTGALYKGDTSKSPFTYRVLETSNDISKGVFKIQTKDLTNGPVTLTQTDFTDRRFNSKETALLALGNYDSATGEYDSDCDFIITGYTNNNKKGTAKVTLRGVNNYSGTKVVSFKIGTKRFLWF